MTVDMRRSDEEFEPEETEKPDAVGRAGWNAPLISSLAPPVDAAVVASIVSESSEARPGTEREVEEQIWSESENLVTPGGPLSPGEAVDLGIETGPPDEDDDASKLG